MRITFTEIPPAPKPKLPPGMKRIQAWLKRNLTKFGTHDDYPGEFHRQILFSLVEPKSKVAWLYPMRPGDKEPRMGTGMVMILTRGSHAAVLVTGSSGARPAMVDSRNIVWCDRAPSKL